MSIERCKNGHVRTIENTGFQKNGAGRITKRCMDCYENNRAHRNVQRAAQARQRRKAQRDKREKETPPNVRPPRVEDSGNYVRYEYDTWERGSTLYMKVTAIEYERAAYEDFHRSARRKVARLLEQRGIDPALAKGIGALREWDRSRNWADLLTESITFEMTRPLPAAELDRTDVASAA